MDNNPRMENLDKIELLILDVDGVLTDGSIIVNADGSETKSFNVRDGHGIRLWQRAGFKTAIISGRTSPPTKIRAAELGIEHVLEGCHYKLPALEKLLDELGLAPENVAYIGDDLPDLPVLRCVGFGAAVADADDEVKKNADYVTSKPAGRGAVREVIEYILKSKGKWQDLMKRYLPDA